MNGIHPIWLIAGSFFLALMPLLVGTATCYVKISIVLSMLKSALGTQGVPGGIVVMSLSLALSLQVMGPTWDASLQAAQSLPLRHILSAPTPESLKSFAPMVQPWTDFMRAHSGERELEAVASFQQPRGSFKQPHGSFQQPYSAEAHEERATTEPGWRQVMLAFVLTELRQAFSMGFVLLLPFLVVDLIVANILVGLGMYMVTPNMIALPLKLILFVAADGWLLLSKGLILSY